MFLLLVLVLVKGSNVTIFGHLGDYKYIIMGCSFNIVLLYIYKYYYI